MTNYRRVANRVALQYGLDPRIFRRKLKIEAGFDPSARSPAGAVGIAQIVPRYHPDVDPNKPGNQAPGVDPIADIRYSAMLDANALKKYGNYRDVLSVYNSGRPWAEGQSIAETRDYVQKILGGSNPGPGSGGGPAAAPLPGATPAPDGSAKLDMVRSLLTSMKQHDPAAQLAALKTLKGAQAAPTSPGLPGAPPAAADAAQGGGTGALKELIYDPLGSIFDGVRSHQPYGGHSDHDHVADNNPQQMLAIIRHALAMGMRVSENPYVDHVDPVHAENSWHYKTFGGKYNGRKLGMGADVSGDPRKMAAFFKWVARNYG